MQQRLEKATILSHEWPLLNRFIEFCLYGSRKSVSHPVNCEDCPDNPVLNQDLEWVPDNCQAENAVDWWVIGKTLAESESLSDQ